MTNNTHEETKRKERKNRKIGEKGTKLFSAKCKLDGKPHCITPFVDLHCQRISENVPPTFVRTGLLDTVLTQARWDCKHSNALQHMNMPAKGLGGNTSSNSLTQRQKTPTLNPVVVYTAEYALLGKLVLRNIRGFIQMAQLQAKWQFGFFASFFLQMFYAFDYFAILLLKAFFPA